MPVLFESDLLHIFEHTKDIWGSMRGERLFLTGGTGFVGSWLVESLVYANNRLNLGIKVFVLTRDPAAFSRKHPHLVNAACVEVLGGDVRNFEPPKGTFAYLIHAATDASAKLNSENPLLMADTIVEGTRRVLEFARHAGVKRMLMLSSGAVYGKLMPGIERVAEDYSGGPDPLNPYYTYSEAKRMAELLSAIYASRFGLTVPVARLFAFVGPRLSLDAHFAVGNFIRDGLHGETISVEGDGTAVRSYLYAADLAVWLWTLLHRGEAGRAYNVGSDEAITIRELAETVARGFPQQRKVFIAGKPNASNPVNWYVPDTGRARSELGLKINVPLGEALKRTISWHQYHGGVA